MTGFRDPIETVRPQEEDALDHLTDLVHGGEFAAWLRTADPEMPFAAMRELDEAREFVAGRLRARRPNVEDATGAPRPGLDPSLEQEASALGDIDFVGLSHVLRQEMDGLDGAARVATTPRTAFRPERLIVSPGSFPVSRARRALTWPLVTIGDALDRARRGVARLLRVDLHAVHERREYLGPAEAACRTGDDELSWDDDGDPYVVVRTPRSHHERLLATNGPLGRASRRLSRVRIRWQEAQLSTLVVRGIKISGAQMLSYGGTIPADMMSAMQLTLATCAPACSIEVEVENRNRRECRLTMALIGTSLE